MHRTLNCDSNSFEAFFQWNPSLVDWLKINSDGSVIMQEHAASCGVILRDHDGVLCMLMRVIWAHVPSFMQNCGGIIHGLRLAAQLGYG